MTFIRQSSCSILLGLALSTATGFSLTGVLHAENPDDVARLLATRECAGCDFQDAQLIGKNFNTANLTGANFSGAFLYRTTLRKANLKGASFAGADLKGTDLTGATDANLAGAVTDEHTTCPSGQPGPCAS